jgi:two-component system sensor histidine kinase/response regulator
LSFSTHELQFSVQDEGVGMSEEIKSNLFKIAGSDSKRGTAGEKGTGLGLLICADFVKKHNGKMWVESKEHEGTTFYFAIPINKTSSEDSNESSF